MISISMTVWDLAGNVVINNTNNSRFTEIPSRVSRIATLDGSAVITHSGTQDADRIFYIDCKVSNSQKTSVEYIHKNSTSILISCEEGLFFGAISKLNIYKGNLKATILIKSKEN
jgi:hypothetical protein